MSQTEMISAVPAREVPALERRLAELCAPTLLGEKSGSLLCLSQQEFPSLRHLLARYNDAAHGPRFEILRERAGRSLVFVYWPARLEGRLAEPDVAALLRPLGYPAGPLDRQLHVLRRRLEAADFPHEIGLFLDYPVADVVGFARNGGANCKLCGYWKVYGDVACARAMFARYDACRDRLCRFLEAGNSISQLYSAA